MNGHPSIRFGEDPMVLDDATVERLLDGLDPDDAPPAYAAVAAVLSSARMPTTADELGGDDQAVAAFRSAWHAREDVSERHRVHGSAGRRVAGAVVLCASLGFASATSAAAAGGMLPTAAQQAAHVMLAAVGVHVPAASSTHPSLPGVGGRTASVGNPPQRGGRVVGGPTGGTASRSVGGSAPSVANGVAGAEPAPPRGVRYPATPTKAASVNKDGGDDGHFRRPGGSQRVGPRSFVRARGAANGHGGGTTDRGGQANPDDNGDGNGDTHAGQVRANPGQASGPARRGGPAWSRLLVDRWRQGLS